jgi:hypothetical protein
VSRVRVAAETIFRSQHGTADRHDLRRRPLADRSRIHATAVASRSNVVGGSASSEPAENRTDTARSESLDPLAASQDVVQLQSSSDLLVELWDPHEELERFLSAVREDRRVDLA